MSGLAMQAAQSSRPASGAGHQFSHTWEMEGHGLDWEPPLSHGMKVGVGTVASLAIWEEALQIDMDALDVEAIVAAAKTDEQIEERVRSLLIPTIADEAVGHAVFKNLQGEELRQRIRDIQRVWPSVRARVESQLMSPEEAAERLDAVGGPSHPEPDRRRHGSIPGDPLQGPDDPLKVHHPRRPADIGKLDDVVDKLFAPDGYWGKHFHADKEISNV